MTSPIRANNKLIVALISIGVLILAIAWMAGIFTNKIEPGLSEIDTTNYSQTGIPIRSISIEEYESVPASLTAKQATRISSRILARIVSVNVRAGDTVKSGQVLVELEKSDLQAQAKQAGEMVRSIQARLTEAEQNLTRINTLHNDGVISKAEYEKAVAAQQSLAAELSASQLAYESSMASLAYTSIEAPIDGRVVDRFAEPGDTATPGSPLMSLYNPLTLQVDAQVREQLAIRLKTGDPVFVDVPARDKKIQAFVEEIVPAADPNSRSFTVKARFEYDSSLLPGMYARLRIPIASTTKLVVPKNRIAEIGQLNLVWIIRDGQLERRFVKLGEWEDETNREVVSGVKLGDLIAIIPNING